VHVLDQVAVLSRAPASRPSDVFASARAAATAASLASTSSLHTSAVLRVPGAKRKSVEHALTRAHREERFAVARAKAANAPHVVLGTRPGEEYKWSACDLATCVVTPEKLAEGPVRGYHVSPGSADERLLFSTLPALTAEMGIDTVVNPHAPQSSVPRKDMPVEKQAEILIEQYALEGRKAAQLERLLDLRNANAEGLAFENRRRIIDEFSAPDKPGDSGRTEVQGTSRPLYFSESEAYPILSPAALLTMRIRGMWDHLTAHKKDVACRLNLRKLIHQRAKVLKYLRRTSRERYDALLPRLAIEPEAVEGEIIV
jgi:small subunit ribosomal protein S15